MGGDSPFVGMLLLVPYNFAPRGWAVCDGSLLAISQNDVLFNLIGTTFGGDGQNTFALPDLRGRAAIHAGNGPGLSPHVLGEKAGTETVTLTSLQMAMHTHQFRCTSQSQGSSIPTNSVPAGGPQLYGPTANATLDPRTVSNIGGNSPHNNIEPYLCLKWIIALEGIYPTQN